MRALCHNYEVNKYKVGLTAIATLLGGYAFADAWDVVPGPLTLQPPVEKAAEYPLARTVDLTAPDVPSFSGTAPTPTELEQIGAEYLADPDLEGELAFIIDDPQTGERLLDMRSDAELKPASTQKYLTAVAALHQLGPDATLPTTTKLTESTVYLVGGGDVLLSSGVGDPLETNGRAGLKDLAEATAAQLATQGVSDVNVVVDSSLFSGPLYHPEVEGTVNTSYVMESRPIAIDRSLVDEETWQIYTRDPDLSAANVFAEHLRTAGVSVTEVARGTTPDAAVDLAVVDSAPVREIVDFMMVTSDNTIAETLGRMVAVSTGEPADFTGATRAVTGVLATKGYPLAGVTMDDLSGLSDNNRITANLLAYILQDMWDCDGCPTASLAAALPVATLQGTLNDRFDDSLNEGNIRAKTGTLLSATTLAGYMTTESGYPLSFVVLNSGHSDGYAEQAREIMDEALEKVAAAG